MSTLKKIRRMIFGGSLEQPNVQREVDVTEQEELLLAKVAPEHKLDTLINLRFRVWLDYNKLKPNAQVKAQMRRAFHGGFMGRELAE